MIKRIVICIAAIALLAGCGQKASTRNNSVTSPAPVASTAPGAQSQSAGAPAASTAPVPAGMDCGGGQPVWINERSHVYHVAGDPWYGRTKHGRYLCERDARKEGYHESKVAH
jgi:hypothetical protein